MKLLTTVVLFLITTPCFAQVTVSDRLPPPVKYPAEVYMMSPIEFQHWAEVFNQGQFADWEQRKAAITEPEWIYGTETRTERDYFGSGLGDYGPSYGFGYWSGFYRPLDSGYYGASSQRQTTIPLQWRNPNYVGPGPLNLVNPYCPPKETP